MSTDNAGDGLREALGAHQRQIGAGGSCICGEWPRPARDVDWLGHLIDQIAPFLAEHPATPAEVECDCYPGGFTGDTFEGPREHCPVHGRPAEVDAGDVALTEAERERAEDACRPCGSCDSGLPMGCNCDSEPRAVIAYLLTEVDRLAAREREAAERVGERMLSVRRFAEAQAITAKACGLDDRDWLDLLHLLDRP